MTNSSSKHDQSDLKCLHCCQPCSRLYKHYPSTNILTLEPCKKCSKDVDYYIEYSPSIKFIDLLLLQENLFIHLFYNQNYVRNYKKQTFRFVIISLIVNCLSDILGAGVMDGQKFNGSEQFELINNFSNLTNDQIFSKSIQNPKISIINQPIILLLSEKLFSEMTILFVKNLLELIIFIFFASIFNNFDYNKLPKIILNCYSINIFKILVIIYVDFYLRWIYNFIIQLFFVMLVSRFYYAIDFRITCISEEKTKDDDDDEKIFRPNRVLMKFKMLLAAGLAFYLKERFVLLV